MGARDDPSPARNVIAVPIGTLSEALKERHRKKSEEAANVSAAIVPTGARWWISMESDRRIGDRVAFVVFRSTEIWKWSAGGRPEAYWPPEDHVRHALHDEVPVSVPFPDLARNAMEVPAGATASQVMLGNSEARTSPAGIDRYVPFPRFGHSSEMLSIRRFAWEAETFLTTIWSWNETV